MRITTKAIFDIETGRVVEWQGYDYEGPLELCGGGPSPEQKQAAVAQAENSKQEAASAATAQARQTDAYNTVKPYAENLMETGLPYYGAMSDWAGGNAARSIAPARAQLARTLSATGSLPSGFKTAQEAGLNENAAGMYDQGLQGAQQQQQAAKQGGADMISGFQNTYNPNAAYANANSANNSIMQAPLQRPGAAGVIGGLLGGVKGSFTTAAGSTIGM